MEEFKIANYPRKKLVEPNFYSVTISNPIMGKIIAAAEISYSLDEAFIAAKIKAVAHFGGSQADWILVIWDSISSEKAYAKMFVTEIGETKEKFVERVIKGEIDRATFERMCGLLNNDEIIKIKGMMLWR